MRRHRFVTVDVFTDRRFGGNPLAVFPDAEGLSDREMQCLAAEFNLSETTFVLPPRDPANSARVRIFNRRSEMPFAGHPNVGTGWVLAGLGRDRDGVLRFEELAGLVEVRVERSQGQARTVTIDAPQPLNLGSEMPAATLAACIGLSTGDVIQRHHRPIVASVGNSFVIAELEPAALARAAPDVARLSEAAASLPELGPRRLPLYLYARSDGGSGATRLQARMFSPLSGTLEDAATGSAATPLAALLLSLSDQVRMDVEIVQGVEMGRPSTLRCSAWRAADGWRASVGGACVPVLEGELIL
ncbi:MAG: PhzF family phenazine biosynthesis protein [Reyranellaceae bacterium]